MDDVLKIALSEALKKQIKKQEISIKPGDYHVDETVTLHVSGNVTKLDNREVAPTTSIPWLTTLALILEKAGFQRERAKELIIEAMIEAIYNKEKAQERMKERIKDWEIAMTHVREITRSLPKETYNGPTIVNAVIQEL